MRKISLLLLLTILTFLLVSNAQAVPNFIPGNRLIVIRIDDIQDYPGSQGFDIAEKVVLRYHLETGVPAFLAIIASRFGTDANLTSQIKAGIDQGIFTIGIHGWHHESFTDLTPADQTAQMQYAKARIETVLGIQSLSFVPPYGTFNRGTIDAMKKNDLTLISPAGFAQDIPKVDGGIVHLPQTVTTAEVDNQSDSWDPFTLDSIVRQITGSWSNYGIAVVVIHPRQFVDQNGTWAEDRWQIYLNMISWIRDNNGDIIRVDPPSPPIVNNLNPLLISVATFSGLTSALLIAFNLSSKRNKRSATLEMANTASASNVVSAQPVPSAHSPRAWSLVTLGKLGITRARPSTKIVIGLGMASSVVLSALWLTSGKTYLDLGLNWIGLGAFGVGFFQGKIFYSSAITFILTFVISYFILVERQSRNPIVSIAVSALVVLSAAYTFEFVYLYLNNQALLKYLTRFNWWFNLLAGLIIGFGFRFMRINKVSIALFSLFAASFAVWYFAGYPQLADKEIPVQLFTNYIGLPVDWAYPLNAIAKLLGCLATASLLIGGGMRLHSGAPTLELASIAQPTREIGILRNLGSIFNRPLGACAHCGRKLRYKDRYCDSCGKPIGSSSEIPASTLF